MKLNDIIDNYSVAVYSSKPFQALSEKSNQTGSNVVLSTESPIVMYALGVREYYAPVLPDNAIFHTANEILEANLDATHVYIYSTLKLHQSECRYIVSNYPCITECLLEYYPDSTVITGSITPDLIKNLNIAGILPPDLIRYCRSYQAVRIKDFDYLADGHLSKEEIKEHFSLGDIITVKISRLHQRNRSS